MRRRRPSACAPAGAGDDGAGRRARRFGVAGGGLSVGPVPVIAAPVRRAHRGPTRKALRAASVEVGLSGPV